MTPADKQASTDVGVEPEGERTSVIATESVASADEPTSVLGKAVTNGKGSAHVEALTVAEEDVELDYAPPPPWQRVPAAVGHEPTVDLAVDLPADEDTYDIASVTAVQAQPQGYHPVDATATATVERPVVTGTAAARMFGDQPTGAMGPPIHPTATAPGAGVPVPPPSMPSRSTVHLDHTGPQPALAGMRTSSALPTSRRPGRGPRRANLQIKRFDPWSVLKLSLVLGVALFFVWLVAVGVLYAVLDGMGVWDKLNGISSELLQANSDSGSSAPLISAGRVFGVAAILGAINIVLFSALSTVGAFIYNVSADLAGGLEVTLAERE